MKFIRNLKKLSPRRGALMAAALVLAVLPVLGCSAQGENAEFQAIDTSILNFATLTGIYIFEGEIDNDLTASCGSATASTGSTGTSSGTSGESGGGSNNSEPTTFNIDSFYTFESSQTMQLKYQYFTTRQSFSLAPTNSTIQTCNTQDFVNCDTSGSFTCETEDQQTCGGTRTFIFVDSIAGFRYQGLTGTINWEEGYSLNEGNTAVSIATLSIEMVSSGGIAFQGRVRCVSDEL